jgi:Pvc16 N-terminal domain
MASWQVIENTGLTLVSLLQRRVDALGLAGVNVGLVTAAAFRNLAATATPFISVFLFQVSGNAELRNQMMRTRADGTRQRQPLPLELGYLITPWGVRNGDDAASDSLAAQEEARLLGAVMQACYEHAEVGRAELVDSVLQPVWGDQDSLQIVLESLPIETHYRIWDAGELGYRLSAVYRLRVASLEPLALETGARVTEADLAMQP